MNRELASRWIDFVTQEANISKWCENKKYIKIMKSEMRFEIRHFLFFISKFQWISNLSASIESSQQRESILLLKKPRALQNDEKMKQLWKSWNFRWDSKSHHFQFFIFRFHWISDLRALIERFHQRESMYVSQEVESSSEWWKNEAYVKIMKFQMRFNISSFSIFQIEISMNYRFDISNRKLSSSWIEYSAREVESSSECREKLKSL